MSQSRAEKLLASLASAESPTTWEEYAKWIENLNISPEK